MRALMIVWAAATLTATAAQAQTRAQLTITDADYPNYAKTNGLQGRTTVEVELRANGTVSACKVVRSSGYGLLDDKTCELYLARAFFLPVPAAKVLQAQVQWRMGDPVVPNSLHVLQGFSQAFPTLQLGATVSREQLATLFPGRCSEQAQAGRSFVCKVDPALFAGLGAAMAQEVTLTFDADTGAFNGVLYLIRSTKSRAAKRVIAERMGKPCYTANKFTAWVDGGAYAVLSDSAFMIVQRGISPSNVFDDACHPPPLD